MKMIIKANYIEMSNTSNKLKEQKDLLNEEISKNRNGLSWYLSFKEPTKCISVAQNDNKRLEEKKE